MTGRERFDEEYGPGEGDDGESDDGDVGDGNGAAARRRAKPADWTDVFGGNCDDDFRLGIALDPRGGGVGARLYSEFHHSDIIIASPLGLKLTIGDAAPGGADGGSADGGGALDGGGGGGGGAFDADCLSSLELLLLDEADVMLQQNWEHARDVLAAANARPKGDAGGADITRVRAALLRGHGRLYRQTVVLARSMDARLAHVFGAEARNHAGVVRALEQFGGGEAAERAEAEGGCALARVAAPRVKQAFYRVDDDDDDGEEAAGFARRHRARRGAGATLVGDALEDARWRAFCESVLPSLLGAEAPPTLVYAPSYFDFVRIRGELLRRDAPFVAVSEFSRASEVSRARARFFHADQRARVLLYSGRCDYFKRYAIRGATHAVFYAPPERARAYCEVVDRLGERAGGGAGSDDDDARGREAAVAASCQLLFTKRDAFALERIVGSARARRMLGASKGVFLFMSQ